MIEKTATGNYCIANNHSLYHIIKDRMSRKARKELGIKLPIFGKYRKMALVPANTYTMVVRFAMQCKATNYTLFLSDVYNTDKFEREKDDLEVKQIG